MKAILVTCLSLCFCVGICAADKAIDEFKKVMAGNDSAKKKKAISSFRASKKDNEKLAVLIAAIGDRQVGKYALEAVERATGLKSSKRGGANPGYPGYPVTRDQSGWSAWLSAKKKVEAEKKKMAEIEKKAKEAEKKAQEAADGGDKKEEGKEDKADGDAPVVAKKEEKPDHEKYGKIDRIIFKNGNLLMCYIISKQVDLDGKLTSIDIVHKNGAGQESLDAKMISNFEENVK